MTTIYLTTGDSFSADAHRVVYELYGVRIDDGKGGHRIYPWGRVHTVVKDPEA